MQRQKEKGRGTEKERLSATGEKSLVSCKRARSTVSRICVPAIALSSDSIPLNHIFSLGFHISPFLQYLKWFRYCSGNPTAVTVTKAGKQLSAHPVLWFCAVSSSTTLVFLMLRKRGLGSFSCGVWLNTAESMS